MKVGYIAKRFVRRHLPDPLAFALLNLVGYGNTAELAPGKGWSELKAALDRWHIDTGGIHVLEVGSGRYARQALHMLQSGVDRVTLVDLYAVDIDDERHAAVLVDDCVRLGHDWDTIHARLRVLKGDLVDLPIPPVEARPDLVISAAVLEHTIDPRLVLERGWTWLKPGGFTCHTIDLRDHVFQSPFEMLTYSDDVWNRWLCPKRGFHLNRWRLPDYLHAMEQVGFINVTYEVMARDEAALRDILPRLDARFKHIEPDVLSVQAIHVCGQKPL